MPSEAQATENHDLVAFDCSSTTCDVQVWALQLELQQGAHRDPWGDLEQGKGLGDTGAAVPGLALAEGGTPHLEGLEG